MSKKFTNHSARKTTVCTLKKAKILSSEYIANVTGHRGINFLNDYDEADEEEGRGRWGGGQKTKVHDLSGHERIRQKDRELMMEMH